MPRAPVQHDVAAPRDGVIKAIDVRAIGLAVVALGGGRQRPGERIDPRVGFTHVLAPGIRVRAGQALARVHAATDEAAQAAAQAVVAAFAFTADDAPPPSSGALVESVSVEG